MKIDAHQHFWKYNPQRDAWITTDMQVSRQDFLPANLQGLLRENSIDGCVAVQADSSIDETRFLLQLASEHDFIRGVVGWVDLLSGDLDKRLEEWSSHSGLLKGFRHIVQAEPAGFLDNPAFVRNVKMLTRFNYTYDLLIYPHQLAEATRFVRQTGDQPIVLDHLAKPSIRHKEITEWRKQIKELSANPHVYCKLSGLVTEADWSNWKEADCRPYLEVALDCFGPRRLMFGSDWPVCLLAASYHQVTSIVKNFIASLSAEEKKAIMGENAIHFYNL
ncbi:MAG: amidohydrolase family protein [Bacteroidota bacterium]